MAHLELDHEQQGPRYAKFKEDVRADRVEPRGDRPEEIHVVLKKDQERSGARAPVPVPAAG